MSNYFCSPAAPHLGSKCCCSRKQTDQRQDVQHSLAVRIKAVFAVHLSAKQTCNPSQCESINSAVHEATHSEQS